jgi:hypothetical protein
VLGLDQEENNVDANVNFGAANRSSGIPTPVGQCWLYWTGTARELVPRRSSRRSFGYSHAES